MASISKAEIEKICELAATKAVTHMLDHIGVDIVNHSETRRDFEFLRDWRSLCEMSKRRGTVVVVTIIVGAVFTTLVAGIASWVIGMR